MTTWIIYVLCVGLLLALGARCIEQLCQLAGKPARWVWLGALTLLLVLAASAPFRTWNVPSPAGEGTSAQGTDALQSIATAELTHLLAPAGSVGGPADPSLLTSIVAMAQNAAAATAETVLRLDRRATPLEPYLVAGWGIASLLIASLVLGVYLRITRRLRSWPERRIDGVGIRLAPAMGPMVMGLSRPQVILPQWILERSPEEQRMIVAHEREHIGAHDPLLLFAGCLGVVLLPWHPAVWWMFSRLRFTVEADCDRRVLRRGVSPARYGTLLIDVAERCSALPLGAPALADTTSHLKQRILAMRPHATRHAPLRSACFGVAGATAAALACIIHVPVLTAQNRSDAQISTPATPTGPSDSLDLLLRRIAMLEARLQAQEARLRDGDRAQPRLKEAFQRVERLDAAMRAEKADTDSYTTSIALQKKVQEENLARAAKLREQQMRTIQEQSAQWQTGNSIQSDSLRRLRTPGLKLTPGLKSLKNQNPTPAKGEGSRQRLRGLGPLLREGDPTIFVEGRQVSPSPATDPIVILNGRRFNRSLSDITPSAIETIEVLKGPAATTLYGADGANGAIVITTKGWRNPE